MKVARSLRKDPRLQYLVGSLRGLGRTHPAFERPCGPTWKTKLYELTCPGGCVFFCRGADRELFSLFTPLTLPLKTAASSGADNRVAEEHRAAGPGAIA